MKVVSSNPCDPLERPKALPGTPRGLTAEQIRQLLDVVPTTPVGLRDRAIILTLVMTGRRRAEVMGLLVKNIVVEDRVYYTHRGKGGKTGKRELPPPAVEAINAWLAACGRSRVTMEPDDALWPDLRTGNGITSGTFYTRLRKYLKAAGLPLGGVHIFRHSAAKLRRDAGETVEAVSSFLDHSSLAVTSTYLRRLEGQNDNS
jgi:integrase